MTLKEFVDRWSKVCDSNSGIAGIKIEVSHNSSHALILKNVGIYDESTDLLYLWQAVSEVLP